MKLTTKYLIQTSIKKSNLKKDESDWEYLSKLTHLHLKSKFIEEIEPITECSSVSVIYLQNNWLKTIHGLENFPRLTHLYLQRNKISKIENLQNSKNLKKIYLGHNSISVLENLQNLTEIHIENQHLPQGETFYFDPRCISALAKTLKVLNIANNNVTSVNCLSGLFTLEILIAHDNNLDDLDDVTEALANLPVLKKLNLINNPVCSDRNYKNSVIRAAKSLKDLDGKEILATSRVFIENLVANKESRLKLLSKSSTRENFDFESFIRCATFSKPEDVLKSCSSGNLGSKLFPAWRKHHSDRNLKQKKSNFGSYYLDEIMKSNPF